MAGHVPIDATATITSVAGVVPDLPAFNTQYDALRHDQRPINTACPVLRACRVTSLGPGASAAPLAAEVLADQLCGDPPAVPRYLQRAISRRALPNRRKRGNPCEPTVSSIGAPHPQSRSHTPRLGTALQPGCGARYSPLRCC